MSSLSHKRTAEATRDLAIQDVVAAWRAYGTPAYKDGSELNSALNDLMDALLEVDPGFGKRADENAEAAIDRLAAAWEGNDPDELDAAIDAVAFLSFTPIFFM
jgi:hypothetical protein